jgi:hypothetical protein
MWFCDQRFKKTGISKLASGLGQDVSEKRGFGFFPQLHIWRIGKFIAPEDVDGWMVGLNERLGTMLTPIGAIFLVGFGDRFLSTY